jgi:hypothetical protein
MNKFFLNFFIFSLFVFLPCQLILAGSILDDYKYAWSDNVGWINFEEVEVTDSYLSGYAWSSNSGWINLSPSSGGVLNDQGDLSGYAWGESLGWIDFSNVQIDTETGVFSGTASGDLIGSLTFDCSNCDVRTDWQADSRGGGGDGRVFGYLLPKYEVDFVSKTQLEAEILEEKSEITEPEVKKEDPKEETSKAKENSREDFVSDDIGWVLNESDYKVKKLIIKEKDKGHDFFDNYILKERSNWINIFYNQPDLVVFLIIIFLIIFLLLIRRQI